MGKIIKNLIIGLSTIWEEIMVKIIWKNKLMIILKKFKNLARSMLSIQKMKPKFWKIDLAKLIKYNIKKLSKQYLLLNKIYC